MYAELKPDNDPSIASEVRSLWPLYISHLLQTFGDRIWGFAIPILLAYMFPNTIFPQALYSFVTYLCVFLIMPLFGTWIDNANRLSVLSITIIVQNSCIVISSSLLYIMIDELGVDPSFNLKLGLFFSGLLITSLVGQIMGQGATLALEKDWVVALCGDDNVFRTLLNGRMRRIDLFCKLGAPAIFGVALQFMGKGPKNKIRIGAAAICGWNVIGFFLELYTIKILYNDNLVLHFRDNGENSFEDDIIDNNSNNNNNNININNNNNIKQTKSKKRESNISKVINGWSFYIKSPMLLASLSLCYLYMSVLGNGSLVQAYLKHRGVSTAYLGIARGVGAIFGIMGTFITPFLTNPKGCNMSFITVGGITLWGFWLCLSLTGVKFFAEKVLNKSLIGSEKDDAYVILGCMIIARTPLWAFDMVMTQLMQDRIDPKVRAQVNGVQVAMTQLFTSLIAVLAMVFSSTGEFYILVFITLGVILLGCVTYTFWASCCPAPLWDERNTSNSVIYINSSVSKTSKTNNRNTATSVSVIGASYNENKQIKNNSSNNN